MATFTYGESIVVPAADNDAKTSAEALEPLTELIRVEVQAVGRWFEQYSHRHLISVPFAPTTDGHATGKGTASDRNVDDDNDSDDDDEEDDGSSSNQAYVNITGEWKDQDHYALLGLQDKRWKATQDDIKRAYRKMVLKHHPDKKGEMSAAEMKKTEEYFGRIQKAYELLSNEQTRRLYDSVDEFDDDIPDILSPKERSSFFDIYGPVFDRNAKYIVEQPVPLLGNQSTSYKEVSAFYDFWNKCTSWREFGFNDDEYNLDDAECREEKRWMERQNRNARKRKKKLEIARLRRLASNAYACDPRIKKELLRQRKEKEAAKLARAQKRQQEEQEKERLRKEAEEKKRQEEEEARSNEKKAKEQAKKVRRAFTKACRRVAIYDTENPSSTRNVNGNRVLTFTDMDTLKQLPNARLIELTHIEDDSEFKSVVFCSLDKLNGEDNGSSESSKALADEDNSRVWTDEEQNLLEAAIRSIPKTESKRWEKIAERVPGRTTKACIARIKECMAKVKQAQTVGPPGKWTEEEEAVLTKAASRIYPPGTQGDRWELIAGYLQTHAHTAWRRPAKQIIAKVNALKNVGAELQKKQADTDDFQKFEQKKKRNRARPDEMAPTTII
eukprot:gene3661-8330_t